VLTGLVCLDSGYAWYHNRKRGRCIDAVLERSYRDSDSSNERFIDRPDAERLFERVVRSSSAYSVIVGSYGTGKSTLAREAARKSPGVIYVTIPSRMWISGSDGCLDSALRVAINWRESVTPWRTILLSKFVDMPDELLQLGKRVLIVVFIAPRTGSISAKTAHRKVDFSGQRAISSWLPPATRPGMALAPSSLSTTPIRWHRATSGCCICYRIKPKRLRTKMSILFGFSNVSVQEIQLGPELKNTGSGI